MIGSFIKRIVKAIRLSRNPVYRRGLVYGVGATIEHQAALRPLTLGSVIDIGANKGQFSLFMRGLKPHTVIHAFEPLKDPAILFQRLFANDPMVTLHSVALGEVETNGVIHISGRLDSSSLLPILPRQNAMFPGTAETGTQPIIVRRGDDVLGSQIDLPSPLLIKLDVQGYELAALKGMTHLLDRADYVYAEISFVELYRDQVLAPEFIEWLQFKGFRLLGIYNLHCDEEGLSIQADALFKNARMQVMNLAASSSQ